VRQRTVRAATTTLDSRGQQQGEQPLNLSISIGPVIAVIAGILILIVPRLLNYIVAIYLIVTGLLELFGASHYHFH
jgi:hypothetical protein